MVKDKWGNQCAYCGNEEDLTIDHVVPRTKGGSHLVHNVVCCCKDCNLSKGKSEVWDWYQKQDFFNEERKRSIENWTAPVNKNTTTYRYKPRKNVVY